MGGHHYKVEDLKEAQKFYNECKMIVLKWEKAFSVTESRQPTKTDMEQAPIRVKTAYRKYCKYKKIVEKLKVKAAKEGKDSNLTANTTPQKIFRSLSFYTKVPKDKVPQPSTSASCSRSSKLETKKNKSTAFGRMLSEKLFAIEPSVKRKSKVTPTSSSTNVTGEPETTSEEAVAEVISELSEKGNVEADPNSGSCDSGIASENSNHMETDGDETNLVLRNSAAAMNTNESVLTCEFDSCDDEDEFQVDRSLFSEFLQEDDSCSRQSEPGIRSSSFSIPVLGSCLTGPIICDPSQPATSVTTEMPALSSCFGEEFRRSLNTLNGEDNAAGNSEVFFPSSSFVFRNTYVDTQAKDTMMELGDADSDMRCTFDFDKNVAPAPQVVNASPTKDVYEPNLQVDKENDASACRTPAKRKYTYVFSPSPKKKVIRKFFKSDKNTRLSVVTRNTLKSKQELTKASEAAKEGTIQHVTTEVSPSSESPDSKTELPTAVKNRPTRKKISAPATSKKYATALVKKAKTSSITKKALPLVKAKETERVINPCSSTNVVNDAFCVEDTEVSFAQKKKKIRLRPTKTVNENYVAIDVTKKVFVRRKKGMTGFKAKRLDWKKKKSEAARESKLQSLTCLKCGDIGHFSKFCPKRALEIQKEAIEEIIDDSPWPTLEEAARMVWKPPGSKSASTQRVVVYPAADSSEDLLAEESAPSNGDSLVQDCEADSATITESVFQLANPKIATVSSYFKATDMIDDAEVNTVLCDALDSFGYSGFRPGQKETIFRILQGKSTLLTLSTGSGKSLCYQLPAFLYSQKFPGCLTICITPLISLMEDQVESMPMFLPAACLSRNMTDKKRETILEGIKSRKYKVLLVSPEAVSAGMFGLLRDPELMPPVAFACIDEVHCVTEWSHNFRPAYFQVCKLLREKLCVTTLLGLTATATVVTIAGICDQLKVTEENVVKGEYLPKNLRLSVSRDLERDVALIRLLNGERFRHSESIIIYCTRREECNRVAEVVRVYTKVCAQENLMPGRSRSKISTICEPYHAGLSAAKRTSIQKNFMQGKIRIVVATVAFGMGIDKSDIRAVIHYNMPHTFESYVQEIGRAGRDGEIANCHLFLDHNKGRDLAELKRHVFANSIDRVTVRKLLKKVFKPCVCKNITKLKSSSQVQDTSSIPIQTCHGHEAAFNVEKTVRELDIPEENIETLLCYLENDAGKHIEILPKTYETCRIHSYSGPNLLKKMALQCPPLAVAIALQQEKKNFAEGDAYLEFNYVDAASAVGWNSAVVRKELKSLEWVGSEFNSAGQPTKFRKSGLIVEFSDLAYRCKARGDLTSAEHESIFQSLCDFNAGQERRQLYQLHKVYDSLMSVSTPGVSHAEDDCSEEKSESLRTMIQEYFADGSSVPADWIMPIQGLDREEEIRGEVRSLLVSYKEEAFTGKAVARIFQGIPSPNFPSSDWYRNKSFWRRFLDVDFHFLAKIASEEIVSYT